MEVEMMKKVLIIGGEGYIGNVLSEYLLENGYSVTSYDNCVYRNNMCPLNHTHNPNYVFTHADLTDADELNKALATVDHVVLLAGLVGDPITKKYPTESKMINDTGIKGVIDACKNHPIEKLVFISTCSNYGLIEGDQLADEQFELKPLSLYAKSKVSAEKYLLSLEGKVDFQPTILRFATAFGLSPRMRFDLTISEFTRELAIGNELEVYDADTWRPYCHVKDFARLIDTVLKAPEEKVSFEIFNAGGEINNATKQMIVDAILKKIPEGVVTYNNQGGDPRNYRVSFAKVNRVLNFQPKYSISDGIDELIDAHNKSIFIHVDKNRDFHGNYNISYEI
jgi:nucleoside-diphosphate-sugar epimerase